MVLLPVDQITGLEHLPTISSALRIQTSRSTSFSASCVSIQSHIKSSPVDQKSQSRSGIKHIPRLSRLYKRIMFDSRLLFVAR